MLLSAEVRDPVLTDGWIGFSLRSQSKQLPETASEVRFSCRETLFHKLLSWQLWRPIRPISCSSRLLTPKNYHNADNKAKVIAESLNRNRKTVAEWCEGIKPPSSVESEVLGILRDGAVWKTSDIVAHSRFARRNVMSALKRLLDADKIDRIKRSFYQITNSFLIVPLLSRLTSTILQGQY